MARRALNTALFLAVAALVGIINTYQKDPYRPSSGVCNASMQELIEQYEIRCPETVLQQILHETADLNSAIFLECLNPFGMKESSRKLQKGKCRDHAGYRTLCDAFLDYKRYQDIYLTDYERRHKFIVDTHEEYLDFLVAQNYATDTLYKRSILKRIQNINKQ